MIKTTLFDLDGTFADTAPDLAFALNETLKAHGKTPLSFAQIRPAVSHGTSALIELGFQYTALHPEFDSLRQELTNIYAANIVRETRLFPGIVELLQQLSTRQIQWGIVTNKPAWLTEPLLQGLGMLTAASCVVSGDTLTERKPHPAPLLYACEKTGGQAHECVYVGDAERDIVAGSRAGMHTLVALFGYLGEHDRPLLWGADAQVETPQAIINWIDQHNQTPMNHGRR